MNRKNGKIFITLAKPWFDEKEPKAAAKVVASGWLISGPIVEEFEKKFAQKVNAKYAVAVSSGSAALLIAQQAVGIGMGDEVIVPNNSFVSTATSSMYLYAKPVFADIELKTYGLNPEDIEKRITSKTKAILPVHYAGQSCDMGPIMKIAKKYKLKVVEDAAEAHLSTYQGKKVGTIGDVGIFSFTPSKSITTGEGGIIVTNDKKIADKCRLIRNFHDVGKFEWSDLGFHFRMPEMMGAIGLVQLGKLDRAISIRRKIAGRYTGAFSKTKGLITPHVRTTSDANFQLYTLRLDLDKFKISRDGFINELSNRGVMSRLYFPCFHRQGVFKETGKYSDKQFPNSVAFDESAFSLPIYPGLTELEIKHVIASVIEVADKYRKNNA